MMNRTKKFLLNTVSTGVMQVVTMLVGFILPRVMLSAYGSEINGLVSSISQFISYFNLVEAGLSGAAVYALYQPLAERDHGAINGILSAAKHFYTQTGYIFVSLTVGLAVIYPFYITTNRLSPLHVGALVLILGVNGALEFFTLSKYRALLTADQKTYVISAASTVQIVINTAIIVFLAELGTNIVTVRLAALFSIFLRSAILLLYCRRKYPFLDYQVPPDKQALNKRWDALYLQILGSIQNGAPIMILTLVLKDLKLVSVYSIFNMVLAGIGGILGIFTNGLAASFGDVIARKEEAVLQKAYQEFEYCYYILITWAYSVTFITIMPFINIYTGNITDTNYNLPVVGFLFVLNGLLYNVKTPQGMLVISAGMYRETRWQSTLQGVIVVVFGVILTLIWGLPGVLCGAILSNIYRDFDLLFFVPRNITHTPIRCSAKRIVRIFLCLFLSWFLFQWIKFTPDRLFTWFVYAAFAGLLVMLIVAAANWIMDKEEMAGVLKRLKSVVSKEK